MGKKKKRGNCSGSQISLLDEITTQILLRLPAESIMVCKCVCKAWKSLINENYFVNLHLARLQTNTSSSHILFQASKSRYRSLPNSSMNRYLLNVDNYEVRKISEYPFVITGTRIVSFEDVPIMSTIDGLICFGSRDSYSIDPVVICNPLIRGDYVCLPDSVTGGDCTVTLGFDYSINKYKAVKSSESGLGSDLCIRGCEVFTIGKDTSWRRVDFPYSSFTFYNRGTFHQGSIYWMIRDVMNNGCILEFDLTKEVFSVVSFPSSIRQQTYRIWCKVQLRSLGEYLSLTEREHPELHIWQLVKQNTETKFDSYRRMTIESDVTGCFIYLDDNKDLLLLRTHGGMEPARSENGERIRISGMHNTFYRRADFDHHNRLTNLPNLKTKFTAAQDVQSWCFTPSLVSIKEAMHA